MRWGLLGPEQLTGSRRTRTLGLRAAVRKFNQLAVPGLGGVWFAKQIFLATLGVLIAERLRDRGANVRALEIANAIEALACWCAFNSNGGERDPRLRGRRKLSEKSNPTFRQLRQPRFYVTQPMRMATTEALLGLGFVESGSLRFSSFRCTRDGISLVKAATAGYRPYKAIVEEYLLKRHEDDEPISNTDALRDALSPLVALPDNALTIIREKLCEGSGGDPNATRRKNALAWVRSLDPKTSTGWEAKPLELEVDHWNDLRLGAQFFKARDAAIDVLNAIEKQIAQMAKPELAVGDADKSRLIQQPLKELRAAAQLFLAEAKDPTEKRMATAFCRECVEADPAAVIRDLVGRDGQVLRVAGNDVRPGPAFSAQPRTDTLDEDSEGLGTDIAAREMFPSGISSRINNLYCLELDLQGRLEAFLNPQPVEETA